MEGLIFGILRYYYTKKNAYKEITRAKVKVFTEKITTT